MIICLGGGLEWHVFIRVIPNEQGSTTTWTFIRPDGLNDNQFEEQLENFEIEITKWKKHWKIVNKFRLNFKLIYKK